MVTDKLSQLPEDPVLVLAGSGPRRWSCAKDGPVALHRADVRHMRTFSVDRGSPRESARAILRAIDADRSAGLAVAGYWSYELGAALERTPRHSPLPDAAWLAFDPAALRPIALPSPPPGRVTSSQPLPAGLTAQRSAFQQAAAEVAELIAAGEVYQVNLTVAFDIPLQRPGLTDAVQALLSTQAVPYAAALELGDVVVLSGSMERFLRVQGDRVWSRPIKGTSPRGSTPGADAAQAGWLASQPKERAENTMIVDMVRNDLQRACQLGSVRVPELLTCEPYATLWHLESEVEGRLIRPEVAEPLLEATLPPASVTGCPKIRAMAVIDALEQRARGIYCGALGVLWPGGDVELAVAIRTLWWHGDQCHTAVGAGLVADSEPEAEWRETCLKAKSALQTMAALGARWD